MESDPLEPLLPGTGKTSPAEECSGSGSGADTSETSRARARRSPPPPPSLGLGGVADSDLEAPDQTPPASSSSHGDTTKNADGDKIYSPLFHNGQDPGGLGNRTSTPPSSAGAWWYLLGRLRRRAPPRLPVFAPPGSTRMDRPRKSVEELRPRGARLDSVGVERLIGIFGFSLFGSLSLFPYTIDRIKDFSTANKSIVMFGFGVIWVLASVGVLSGLQGKSDFEQAFCRFTGRLGVVGLAVLVTPRLVDTAEGQPLLHRRLLCLDVFRPRASPLLMGMEFPSWRGSDGGQGITRCTGLDQGTCERRVRTSCPSTC